MRCVFAACRWRRLLMRDRSLLGRRRLAGLLSLLLVSRSLRVVRQVDRTAYAGKPNADAHLCHGRSHRPNHHPQHSQSMAHFFSDASSRLRACCQRTVTPSPSFKELLSGQTSRLSARCSVRQRTLRRPGPDQAKLVSAQTAHGKKPILADRFASGARQPCLRARCLSQSSRALVR